MQSVVGIFATRSAAELAVQGLLATPIPPQSITLLSGEAGESQVASLKPWAVSSVAQPVPVRVYPWAARSPACSCPAWA